MKLFSKLLTRTDVLKRLSIPIKRLITFPRFKRGQYALNLRVKDDGGGAWTFRFSVRKKKYLKPVFSAGWCNFARSKNLNVGDKVKFYKEADEDAGTSYKIRVKRAVKIFGAVIGYTKA